MFLSLNLLQFGSNESYEVSFSPVLVEDLAPYGSHCNTGSRGLHDLKDFSQSLRHNSTAHE